MRGKIPLVGIVAALFVLSGGIFYWWKAVYPFLELAPGRLAVFTTTVNAKAGGRISEVGPREGDGVKQGDLLFALDRALLMMRKAQLEAELQKEKNELASQQERVQKALEAYLSEIAIPEEASQHLLAMQEAQVKIESIKADLASVQQELRSVDLQIGEKAYAAPFDGIVLKQTKNAGVVAAEGDAVYVIADPQKMWVETSLSEQELSRVQIGMKARVQVAAYPKKEWNGVVSWIAPATFEGQDRVGVRIALENPDERLKPGLSASVAVQIR